PALPSFPTRRSSDLYGLDPDAMRKPAPSDSALQGIAAGIREKYEALNGDELDPSLWAAMLDLIYSGNAASARALFDAAWPEAKRSEEHTSELQSLAY